MTDAGIGRLLISSLHQGIADVRPNRLDFYENWLSPTGMRDGRIGLAPLGAVLSFLHREEAPANDQIVERAGRYAADWTFADVSALRRWCIRRLPMSLRARAALGLGTRMIRADRQAVEGRDALHRRLGRNRHQLRFVRSAPGSGHYSNARLLRVGNRSTAAALCGRRRGERSQRPARGVEPGDYRQGAATARSRRRCMMWARVALWLIAIGAAVSPPVARAQVPPGATVLVIPFDNPTHEPRLTWMRDGAAILLGDMLAASGETVIEREERLQAFDRLQLPANATLSRASTIRVGQTVAASLVVSGTVAMEGDRLLAKARAVRLDTGRLLPEVEAAGPLSDLFGVFGRLAQQIRGASSPATAAAADRLPATPQVFELYVKGLVAETPTAALAFLEQALKAAPSFDRARLAVWDLQSEASEHPRALETVNAIRPDSRYARDGRFRRALSLMHLKRFDESLETLRVMQKEEASATVANAIGVVELRRAATPQPGRATYYFSQASELDPTDGDFFFNLGYAYWIDKDSKAAIYWLREAVRRDPGDGDAHFVLGVALQQAGGAAEAARERELAARLSSKYAGWEKTRPPGGDAVPRGLERLHEELTPARARVDSIITTAGQREQQSLALFHLDAGRRAFEREADRDAIDELRRALYLSPYLAEAHLVLGRLYLRGGRAADAVEALKIALWSEETAATHVALAEALLQVDDQMAARAELDRALALDPKSAEALALKAKIGGPW
jgi:tetratricopeptide (TPR) repeat protein